MLAFKKLSIIALVATLPLAAHAASNETHSIAVRTYDINLNTKKGQEILALRDRPCCPRSVRLCQ